MTQKYRVCAKITEWVEIESDQELGKEPTPEQRRETWERSLTALQEAFGDIDLELIGVVSESGGVLFCVNRAEYELVRKHPKGKVTP